jgi:hypothetical protein
VQYARLCHFHAPGLAGEVVVVATQMQGAVHDEMRQVMRWAAAGGGGLAAYGFERQHNVAAGEAAHRLEGKHVGGFVTPAVARVQALDRAVGGQHDRAGAAGGFGCPGG